MLAARHAIRLTSAWSGARALATASLPDSLHLSASTTDGVAVLEMKDAPVNALSSAFMESLCIAADQLARDDAVRAVVLTSNVGRPVFSAGLNLAELIVEEGGDPAKPDKRLVSFMAHIGAVTRAWLSFPKPMVASINGASPAGGCMLALTADYRVMQSGEKHKIGLNETQVGVSAPWWLSTMLQDTVGVRRGERMLQLGELVGPEEALEMGLVDEVMPTEAETLARAVEMAAKFAAVPDHSRRDTKQALRGPFVAKMEDRAAQDATAFATHVMDLNVQKQLRRIVEGLAKR